MQIKKVTPDSITYNPVTNMFEANVELKADGTIYHYPCAVEGALMMPLAMAAFKLTQQAKHRHASGKGLHTRRVETAPDGMTWQQAA
ncbi:hypothetical protein [Sulfitobacter pacificus]|uniref:KTSC domain-containing protein n=1 Tax=Sulfitobacter pacificus TaxID=1499314 RepID=A0ABQ5VNV3_9RHOB|nr:hypothetical protein [Sulfitobacter pacificus]GLQ28729.1 hypothetical protein GCM10007927_35320 [Sulfitobacter pacificus]